MDFINISQGRHEYFEIKIQDLDKLTNALNNVAEAIKESKNDTIQGFSVKCNYNQSIMEGKQ